MLFVQLHSWGQVPVLKHRKGSLVSSTWGDGFLSCDFISQHKGGEASEGQQPQHVMHMGQPQDLVVLF